MNCSPAASSEKSLMQVVGLPHQRFNINSYKNMSMGIDPYSNMLMGISSYSNMPMGINPHNDISTGTNPYNAMLLPQQEVASKHPADDERQMGDGAAPPRNKRSHGSVESDSIPEGSSAAARRRRR
jgi:hypothetical protein